MNSKGCVKFHPFQIQRDNYSKQSQTVDSHNSSFEPNTCEDKKDIKWRI